MGKQHYSRIGRVRPQATSTCRLTLAHCALVAGLLFPGAHSLRGQINVNSMGTGVITFETRPPASEWATVGLGGGASDWLTTNDLFKALPAASSINNQVGENAVYSTHGSGFFWNTNAQTLYSDPTGVLGLMLCAKLANRTGTNLYGLTLEYDLLGVQDGMELPGHCVYYSLSGEVWMWINIPDLTGQTGGTNGPRHIITTLDFSATPWRPDGTLYILWVDDNGSGDVDNYVGIDNFCASPLGAPMLLQISPGSTNVLQCSSLIFHASVYSGVPPYTVTWMKDGVDLITQTAGPYDLVLTNLQESDAGSYAARVMDASTVVVTSSLPAVLTVTPDTSSPVLLSVSGWTDLYHVTVSFSKPVCISGLDAIAIKNSGGSTFALASAAVQNETNVFLTTSNPRSWKCQVVLKEGAITDRCNGSAVPPATVDILNVLTIPWNYQWFYDDSGLLDRGTAWKEYNYPDEATWPSGPGVFDAKLTDLRATVGGVPVGTRILLSPPNSPFGSASIPTYYFRTHFTFPQGVNPMTSRLELRRLFDDFGIIYLNGREIYRDPNIADTNEVWGLYATMGSAVLDPAISDPILLSPGDFQVGDNVIAVLLKQYSSSSTDITMGLELTVLFTNYYHVPPVIIQITPATNTLMQGEILTLTAQVDGGTRPFQYQWYRGTNGLTNEGNISGANTNTLMVTNVQPEDSGNYSLRVTCSDGETTLSSFVPVTILQTEWRLDLGVIGYGSVGPLKLHGLAGNVCEIQGSTNLTDWVPLGRITNSTGALSFTDNTSTNLQQRFYRAVAK